jgi:choline dehydrogenase-like flavoprotein
MAAADAAALLLAGCTGFDVGQAALGALALTALVAAAAWATLRPARFACKAARAPAWPGDAEYADYVIVGGGASGLYLSRLLRQRFPERSVVVLNRAAEPPWLATVYMVNVILLVVPWLVPHVNYALRSVRRQFANCEWLGGSTNINAAVCPLPSRADAERSLGAAHGPAFEAFLASELALLARPAPRSPGLERLSADLAKVGVEGGGVHVFARGISRIHPLELVPASGVELLVCSAERLVFERAEGGGGGGGGGGSGGSAGLRCAGALCRAAPGAEPRLVRARRATLLCCGALESPALLMRSGVGPRATVERLLQRPALLANEHVGANLQDHWVGRASAAVPAKYAYPRLFPALLAYKHQLGGVAVGFGKLQLVGANLLSFATTRCLNPGRVVLTADGRLEPYLPLGADDLAEYHRGVAALVDKLRALGVTVKPDMGSQLAPNWHLCGTLAAGSCCDERSFALSGVDALFCADLSVLKHIVPMNTQIMAYFVAYLVAHAIE